MTQESALPTDALPEEGKITAKDGTVVIVRDNETFGAVFLGLLVLLLLAALLRAEGRNRKLLSDLAAQRALAG